MRRRNPTRLPPKAPGAPDEYDTSTPSSRHGERQVSGGLLHFPSRRSAHRRARETDRPGEPLHVIRAHRDVRSSAGRPRASRGRAGPRRARTRSVSPGRLPVPRAVSRRRRGRRGRCQGELHRRRRGYRRRPAAGPYGRSARAREQRDRRHPHGGRESDSSGSVHGSSTAAVHGASVAQSTFRRSVRRIRFPKVGPKRRRYARTRGFARISSVAPTDLTRVGRGRDRRSSGMTMHDVRVSVAQGRRAADVNELLLPLIARQLTDLPDDRTSERRRLQAQEATLRGGDRRNRPGATPDERACRELVRTSK